MKKQDQTASAQIVLKALQDEAKAPMKKVQSLIIKSQSEYELASKHMKQIKQYAKMAKEKEDSLTQPLNQVIKDIRALFKPFRDAVSLLEEDTKTKMLEFVNKQKEEIKKVEQQLESGQIKKVSTAVSKIADLQVTSSSSQIRKIWQAVEVNASKTPREYMKPDLEKIKAALKEGKKVAGWKWEQVESIAI